MAAAAASPPTTARSRGSNDSLQADPEDHALFFQPMDNKMASSQTLGYLFMASANKDQHEPAAVLPDTNLLLTILSIVGGCLFASLLAAGHHLFLLYLHGRNVEYFSQFWVKNTSNALSNMFSLSLALSVTCALIQIKWRVATSNVLQIRIIDNLFALPSPLAVLGSVVHLGPSLLLPIGASIFIHALVIVNVLAPNALTISLSERVSRDIKVPTLDLGSVLQEMGFGVMTDTNMSVYPEWEARLHSILLHPPEINWEIPQECGSACHFELGYDGPALECRDTTPDEYRLYPGSFTPSTPPEKERPIYEGNATISQNTTTAEFDAQYYLRINYAQLLSGPEVASEPGSWLSVVPGGGTYCRLRNATYNAVFEFFNNTQQISTSIKSYGAVLSNGRECELVGTNQCVEIWWPNTWALFYVFTTAFTGTARTSEFLTHDFPNTTLFTESLFTQHFNFGVGDPVYTLAVSNLTETISGLFANMTLGLIPYLDEVVTVKASVSTGISVWEYTYWKLWAVYGSAFLLGLPVVVYGMYCVHSSKAGMDDKFSNYLLATRGDDLDEACKRVIDFKHLLRVRLVHQTKGVFTVEPEAREEGDNPK